MPLTTYGETFSLKKLFGQAVASRTDNYLGLGFGSDLDGITNEITEAGYARVSIPTTDWLVSLGKLSNSQPVYLSSTSTSFGSPTSWGIFDALTNGNCLFTGVINPTQEIAASQQIYFPVGELNLSLSLISAGTGMTETWKNNVLGDLVGKTNITAPTMYVGFSSSTDLETTITGETFTGGYARTLFGSSTAVTEISDKAVTNNVNAITFSVTGDWGTNLVRMFIADDSSATAAANLIYVAAILTMSPELGDVVEVAANDFELTLE